ncbi:hypothetical protein [Nocardioides sp.]|uniref:hypothetical protein n=1 Tax=Nocardioides sp. TaxID=35761 RepID=UPI0035118D70
MPAPTDAAQRRRRTRARRRSAVVGALVVGSQWWTHGQLGTASHGTPGEHGAGGHAAGGHGQNVVVLHLVGHTVAAVLLLMVLASIEATLRHVVGMISLRRRPRSGLDRIWALVEHRVSPATARVDPRSCIDVARGPAPRRGPPVVALG